MMKNNSPLIIDRLSKNKFFFDQYQYSYKFFLAELSSLRKLNHEYIDEVIDRRKHIGFSYHVNYGGSWGRYQRRITDNMVKNLHDFCDFLLKIESEYKFTISTDNGHLYTNDIGLINDCHKKDYLKSVSCKQINRDLPPNSIRILKAKHNKRTYFKNQHITLEDKQRLIEFLKRDDIRISPGMTEWLTKHSYSKYACDNYFIDHNDDSVLTMLSLATGIKIKKTLMIIRDK